MEIVKVGFNYKTTPVDIREKLVFAEDSLEKAMYSLQEQGPIIENVILSTCNRTEIYAVVDVAKQGIHYITEFLADWFQLEQEKLYTYIKVEANNQAVDHLFRVTTGLDSMVLGETEILGQVRDAFLTSQSNQTTGKVFNELFKQAITFGKKSQHETAIGEYPTSISYIAVELAKKQLGNLGKKKALVIGAGKMAELAVKHLRAASVSEVIIVNRTNEKAQNLAKKLQVNYGDFEDLTSILLDVDILVSSTAAEDLIITKEKLESTLEKRQKQQLTMIDIAVPRDIDPEISGLAGVSLFDIDDLQHIVDENTEGRTAAAKEIELQIGEEVTSFNEWLLNRKAVPVISALQDKANLIHTETFKSLERKMPNLTDQEKKLIHMHTKSMINQLLKEPITQTKQLANKQDAEDALKLVMNIFGIEEVALQFKNKGD